LTLRGYPNEIALVDLRSIFQNSEREKLFDEMPNLRTRPRPAAQSGCVSVGWHDSRGAFRRNEPHPKKGHQKAWQKGTRTPAAQRIASGIPGREAGGD
jgi:hypothetical protein